MDESRKDKILAHLGLLAMQTCMDHCLDSVNGSDIYHVPGGSWQAGELLKYEKVCIAHDAIAFEQAVQNPEVRAIFVPTAAYLTQGIAVSVLQRNPLRKQVFWEGRKATPDAKGGTYLLESEPSPIVIRGFQECTSELERYLQRHPEALRELHPGTFENIVAEIFCHEGFETERISSWNQPDGGVDLIAVRHIQSSSNIRLAVQCKRWARSRKISADPIRALAGVLDRFKAHAGVVATTGFFSEEAIEETENHFWRISLRDYNSIVESLKSLRMIRAGAEPNKCSGHLRYHQR